MATATMSEGRGPGPSGEPAGRGADARVAAFCSPDLPDPFHAVEYASQVWQPDPFDVDSIHRSAREALRGVVGRVLQPSGPGVGRILLILGEAGSGKTHLMRAFRNELHATHRGYVGYMPMTAYTDDYSRYVLANLIESLDRPYDEPRSRTTGLMRLSDALAEAGRGGGLPRAPEEPAREPARSSWLMRLSDLFARSGRGGDRPRAPEAAEALDALDRLREAGPARPGLADLVREMADRIAPDPRFASIDYDLVQALLYLQAGDPRLRANVLKYLRCEDLTPRDREDLGGIVPRVYASATQWMIQRLGELIWAVEGVPLVLCVDQLEDMFDAGDAPSRFRRVLATLCDITSRLPTAIVVISCLENFYDEVRRHLTQPISRRVTTGAGPLELPAACDRDQVVALVARRLESLYRSAGARFLPTEPTYPLPDPLLRRLVGLGARDVLDEVRRYRQRCIAEGRMAAYHPDEPGDRDGEATRELDRKIAAIEREWNQARSQPIVVPSDESELAGILAEAIEACPRELGAGPDGHYEADADGRFVQVERHGENDAVERILVGICNKAAQGGALSKQIDEVVQRAGGITTVIVRSTAFPASAKSAVMLRLQQLLDGGGRRAVVEDSEWRTMMALSRFRRGLEPDLVFAAWLARSQPLTRLASIRTILGLDRREAGSGQP